MASKKVCSIAFSKALKEQLGYDDFQIDQLKKDYFEAVKNVKSNFEQYKTQDAYQAAVKEMMDIRKIRNINKRRLAYKNMTRRLEIEQFIFQNYTNNYEEGVNRFLQLVHYDKEARSSAYLSNFQRMLIGRDGFGEDYSKFLSTGKYDKLVYQELFYMDNPDAVAKNKIKQFKDGSFTGDPIAYRLAQIVYKVQRIAVQDAIDAGADIALIPGYMAKQSHSMEKFLSTKNGKTEVEQRAAWKKTILQHLDIEKTFKDLPEDVTVDKALDNIWRNITTGMHYSYIPEEMSFIPGRNISKRAGLERKIFFKDGINAYEYMQKYGQDNLREAVLFQLENMAHTTTLLNYMGTNPRYNFESVFRNLKQRAHEENNVKNISYLTKGSGINVLTDSANNQLASLLGEDRRPGDIRLSKVNAMIRSMNNVAFLGGSLITSFMDLASGPTIAHLQGRSSLGAFTDAVKGVTGKLKDPIYRDMLDSIGFINDAFIGQIAEKFSGDVGISRQASYITNKFFQMNGLRWWTDTNRASYTLGMSRDLAKLKNVSFNELNTNFTDFFKRFNITENDWNVLRKYGIKEAINGEAYMLNEAIGSLSDDVIAKEYGIELKKSVDTDRLPQERAQNVYDIVINNTRNKLAHKLQTMLIASGMEAVLLPTVTEKGFAYRATRPGTLTGEMMRHFSQFKQFPYALFNTILKGIAREAQEAGPMEAIKTGALFMAGMIATSYISMTIKDALNNKTPRDLKDPKTLAEVIVRSGALSVYGDLLLNDFSRSPYEQLGTMAGPTISGASELAYIASKAIYKGENVADDLGKFMIQRAPAVGVLSPSTSALAYVNLFYLKPIINYYLLDGINELMNPGYLERNRARLLKQGKDYLVDPRY
jgi:hypothetical protein